MGDHAIKAEAYLSGVWTDVTTEVKEGTAKLERGFTQYGDIRPSSLEWTFEDPSDKWRPGNPLSPVYGLAGLALPIRVSADASVRCLGETTSLEPDQTPDFSTSPARGRRWVDVGAGGILERISGWTTPLRSPMYRSITQRANLIGYWPGEDGRDTESLTNAAPDGTPGSVVGVDFGETDAPGGASSSFSFTNADSTSKVFGKFASASTTAGWQIAWSAKLPVLPTGGLRQMLSWRCSNGYRWAINLDTGVYGIKIDAADGTNLVNTFVGFVGFDPPDQWVTYRMKATVSAGTVTWEFAWYREGATTNWGTSGTFSGTVGALSTWTANGNTYMQDALMAHVYGVTTGTDNLLSTAAKAAFVGYVNELAGVRFKRILDEEGIAWSMLGNQADTLPMGKQPADSMLKLLQEIADTDQSLIYDSRTALQVEMRTRVDMYNQTPVTFTYPDDIAPPFKETYDFVGVTNLVTVSQRDGGEATVSLTSGPMSVQNAPAGIGEKKTGVDVNVGDETYLPSIGTWVLSNGTLRGARYPQVVFDLDAFPALITKVNGLGLGDLIMITGRGPDVLYLIIIGISETLGQKRRLVSFTCIPGDVFAGVATYDATAKRYDLKTSTVKTTVNSAATSLIFRTTDTAFEYWDTSAVPYDLMISGERVRVTVMTAGSIVSGALEQTATVTRAINGIAKTLTAGDEVHIATPGRYGL